MKISNSFFFTTVLLYATTPFCFSAPAWQGSFYANELSNRVASLSRLCLSRGIMPDGSVCNPSYLHQFDPKMFLIGKIFVANGYSTLAITRALIYEPATREFLEELFKKKNLINVDSISDLILTTQYFSSAFSPYRIYYLSEIHNPNFPVLSLHAVIEKRISISGGLSLGYFLKGLEPISVGTRLRLIRRRYVHNTFSVFDVLMSNSKYLIAVQKYSALYLDPVVAFALNNFSMKPRLSLMLKNVGFSWPARTIYSVPRDIDVGFGLESPLGLGKISMGVDFVNIIQSQNLSSMMKGEVSYKLGMTEVILGGEKGQMGGGLHFNFGHFEAGISYNLVKTGFFHDHFEKRIATEMALTF